MLNERLKLALLKKSSVNDGSAHDVWVHVTCGSSVLNVALLLSSSGSRNSDRAGTGANSVGEDFFVGGLVVSSKSLLIVSLERDVVLMLGSHLLEQTFNVVHATLLSHCLGRVIGVTTSTIPVFEELGLK